MLLIIDFRSKKQRILYPPHLRAGFGKKKRIITADFESSKKTLKNEGKRYLFRHLRACFCALCFNIKDSKNETLSCPPPDAIIIDGIL